MDTKLKTQIAKMLLHERIITGLSEYSRVLNLLDGLHESRKMRKREDRNRAKIAKMERQAGLIRSMLDSEDIRQERMDMDGLPQDERRNAEDCSDWYHMVDSCVHCSAVYQDAMDRILDETRIARPANRRIGKNDRNHADILARAELAKERTNALDAIMDSIGSLSKN